MRSSLHAFSCSLLFDARWAEIPKGELDKGKLLIADLVETVQSVRTLRDQMLKIAENAGDAHAGVATKENDGEVRDRSPILTKHIVERFTQGVSATGATALANSPYSHPCAPEFEFIISQTKISHFCAPHFKKWAIDLNVPVCRNLRIQFRHNAQFPISLIQGGFEL